MKKENYCKYDLEELEELIEESYSYYSFLDSKNPDNLTMRFNELCSNIEVSAKLEKLKNYDVQEDEGFLDKFINWFNRGKM